MSDLSQLGAGAMCLMLYVSTNRIDDLQGLTCKLVTLMPLSALICDFFSSGSKSGKCFGLSVPTGNRLDITMQEDKWTVPIQSVVTYSVTLIHSTRMIELLTKPETKAVCVPLLQIWGVFFVTGYMFGSFQIRVNRFNCRTTGTSAHSSTQINQHCRIHYIFLPQLTFFHHKWSKPVQLWWACKSATKTKQLWVAAYRAVCPNIVVVLSLSHILVSFPIYIFALKYCK